MLYTIPAGYRFTFDSSDNDGKYRTFIKEGVSLKETQLLAKLARLIGYCGTGLEDPPDEETKAAAHATLFPIFEEHQELFDDFSLFTSVEPMIDYLSENMLGHASWGCGIRVLENYKIEYFPQEIQIEDVTDDF